MAKQKKGKSAKGASPKHIIHMNVQRYPGGPIEYMEFPVRVRNGTAGLKLTLEEEHVRLAQKAKGQGSTAVCAMAICAQRYADLFSHPVYFIDWQYRTMYAVDKVDKRGIPVSAVRYSHHDPLARINDDPKGHGLRKLRKMVKEKGGKIEVSVRPYQENTWSDKTPAYVASGIRPSGRPERAGERTKDAPHAKQQGTMGTGAKLRFMTAFPGLTSPLK